jgi:cell division protein ZapE
MAVEKVLTPSQYYHEKSASIQLVDDVLQLDVLTQLDRLHADCVARHARSRQWLHFKKQPEVRGLYLWGGVGIGKTFLMDCFYHALPFMQKQRVHFHAFMQQTHEALEAFKGRKDPLAAYAKSLAKRVEVLCFDEFVVTEITDAMLLGILIQYLFAEGVTLLATSNLAPDRLYARGLQRERFLPAIEAIKQHTQVIYLSSQKDYRHLHLSKVGLYFCPLNKGSAQKMQQTFEVLKAGHVKTGAIVLFGRKIDMVKAADGIIWFDFYAICGVPRSKKDYLQLAKQYKTVLVSGVPAIPAEKIDLITSLVHLVDVFYDYRIKLIMSADVSPDQLYAQGKAEFSFARTHSRLMEMQSEDYFSCDTDFS